MILWVHVQRVQPSDSIRWTMTVRQQRSHGPSRRCAEQHASEENSYGRQQPAHPPQQFDLVTNGDQDNRKHPTQYTRRNPFSGGGRDPGEQNRLHHSNQATADRHIDPEGRRKSLASNTKQVLQKEWNRHADCGSAKPSHHREPRPQETTLNEPDTSPHSHPDHDLNSTSKSLDRHGQDEHEPETKQPAKRSR